MSELKCLVTTSVIHIAVRLSTRFEDVRQSMYYRNLIYTGRIDDYFGYSFGKLPYRHVRFDHQVLDQEWFQPVGVVNCPGNERYTRISEHK
jgi:UDP-galactopyranose mutase